MNKKMSRRRFLQTSAVATAGIGYFAVADVTESRAARQNDPMNRLNVAIIGAGGQGAGNLGNIARLNENIVALCDVDARNAAKSFAKYERVAHYQDYRVMLEKQKDIEAVVVSTPDHHHVFASIIAMKMGKHCYTEKPLTHSVWEARQMRDIAAKHKVATQMGNMGTAANGFREAVEIIQAGAIGDIREVHVWTNRPIWPQGMEKPLPRQEVPKTMAWDLWLGPAPERPYNGDYAPFKWRGWWDFGTGAIGDMACHTMNMPYRALNLGQPTSVSAVTDRPVNNQSPPEGLKVTYEFPARGKLPAVRLTWYERHVPPAELFQGQKPSGSGALLIGSRGTFYSPSDYAGVEISSNNQNARNRLLPVKNFEGYRPPQPRMPRIDGQHHAEWIRACKGGPPAMSNFVDYAGPLTEVALLGNVAVRAGKRIDWDPVNLQARNLPAAAQYIRREYRRGWTF
jgi:predicted dehydrogenase